MITHLPVPIRMTLPSWQFLVKIIQMAAKATTPEQVDWAEWFNITVQNKMSQALKNHVIIVLAERHWRTCIDIIRPLEESLNPRTAQWSQSTRHHLEDSIEYMLELEGVYLDEVLYERNRTFYGRGGWLEKAPNILDVYPHNPDAEYETAIAHKSNLPVMTKLNPVQKTIVHTSHKHQWAIEMLSRNFVVLDYETTGITGEPVQIAIIDNKGRELLSTLVCPQKPIEPGAQAVHGISMDDVKGKPTFIELYPRLKEIMNNRTVIAYTSLYMYSF